MFHLLVGAATDCLGQATAPAVRFRIMRAFGHKEMRNACMDLNRVTRATAPKMFKGLVAGVPHPDLAFVADAFAELQIARHDADYDLEVPLTMSEAQAFLDLADRSITVWPSIQPLPETATFLAALLLGDRWTRRG